MPDEVSLYVYGNSLTNHTPSGPDANVMVWMDRFAEAAGNQFSGSGGFGFMAALADRDTPSSSWGFEGVTPSWNAETEAFSDSAVDTILYAPLNFIQQRDPNDPMWDDPRTPVELTVDTLTDSQNDLPSAKLYIYQPWSSLAPFAQPGEEIARGEDLAEYHAYNQGAYFDWFTEYVDSITAADPDLEVTLIPVGRTLAEMLSGPLADIPPEDLYVDSAPHGTETLYFLAGMVTYTAIYGQPVPTDYLPPDNIHPLVAENFEVLTQLVADRVLDGSTGAATGDADLVEEPLDEDLEATGSEGAEGQSATVETPVDTSDNGPPAADAPTVAVDEVADAPAAEAPAADPAADAPVEGATGRDFDDPPTGGGPVEEFAPAPDPVEVVSVIRDDMAPAGQGEVAPGPGETAPDTPPSVPLAEDGDTHDDMPADATPPEVRDPLPNQAESGHEAGPASEKEPVLPSEEAGLSGQPGSGGSGDLPDSGAEADVPTVAEGAGADAPVDAPDVFSLLELDDTTRPGDTRSGDHEVFEGALVAENAGLFLMELYADDVTAVTINGQQAMFFQTEDDNSVFADVFLDAGPNDIRIEYFDNGDESPVGIGVGGPGSLSLTMEGDSQPDQHEAMGESPPPLVEALFRSDVVGDEDEIDQDWTDDVCEEDCL